MRDDAVGLSDFRGSELVQALPPGLPVSADKQTSIRAGDKVCQSPEADLFALFVIHVLGLRRQFLFDGFDNLLHLERFAQVSLEPGSHPSLDVIFHGGGAKGDDGNVFCFLLL